MVATKGQAIGLGVISILVIGCGIAVMVLTNAIFVAVEDNAILTAYWVYGLPIFIIGGLGMLAAALGNNVGVGIYMLFCILCLVAQVIISMFVLFGLLLVSALCQAFGGACIWSSNETSALFAVIIIAWLLMLAGSIASCTACCCGEKPEVESRMSKPYANNASPYKPSSAHARILKPKSGGACIWSSNETSALFAVIIIAWLLMLAGSIASCTACCCGEPQTAPGVAIVADGADPSYEMTQPAQGYPRRYPKGYRPGYAAPGVAIVADGADPGYEMIQPAQGYPRRYPKGYRPGYAAPYPVMDSENRY